MCEVDPILNLLTTQFLNTFTPSNKKDLIPLLNKCHYNHERGEYTSINTNLFKKVFLGVNLFKLKSCMSASIRSSLFALLL